MLNGITWGNQWEYWAKFNNDPATLNHKVMFDGKSKTIWILRDVSELTVKEHLYSDWKEWVALYDHTKWPQAFETEGGRPISPTERLGDSYLLINDWVIRQRCGDCPVNVIGNLYAYDLNGDPKNPYLPDPNNKISVNSTVSNIVNTIQLPTQYIEVPTVVPVNVPTPALGLTPQQETTLNLAYEEARRARALASNRVDIGRSGTGQNLVDNIIVYDDDGTTILYTIVVTGDKADNRQVTYIKPYPS